VPALDGCHHWAGGTSCGGHNTSEYGSFWVDGRGVRAHIFAAVALGDGHAPGNHVDHLCVTSLCVNPAHLEDVPPPVNQARKLERRRR